MLINLIVLIILQYICLASYHTVYLKLIQCNMSIISQYTWEKKEKEQSPHEAVNFCSPKSSESS